MKKPNYKKWAKREKERIKESQIRLDDIDVNSRVARFARLLGGKYSGMGRSTKADYHYGMAAEAYDKAGEFKKRARARRKIGTTSGGLDYADALTRSLGVVGIVFFILGIVFMSARFTGNFISDLSVGEIGVVGAVFFILGILSFYYFKRK